MEEEEKKESISPSEYFEKLKDAKQTITSEKLRKSYGVILELAEKYKKTKQTRSLRQLQFLTNIMGEEEKLINLGVTTFIYRDKIEDYIIHVANNTVKIIELRNYLREIPDEAVEVVEKTKDIFSEFYVVFTDYTGREERRVAQERKDKDPILFGCFKDSEFVADRFYFLCDWTDPYCDLTMSKLLTEYKSKRGQDPSNELEIPQTLDELREVIGKYTPDPRKSDERWVMNSSQISTTLSNKVPTRKSFFERVRSIFKK